MLPLSNFNVLWNIKRLRRAELLIFGSKREMLLPTIPTSSYGTIISCSKETGNSISNFTDNFGIIAIIPETMQNLVNVFLSNSYSNSSLMCVVAFHSATSLQFITFLQ